MAHFHVARLTIIGVCHSIWFAADRMHAARITGHYVDWTMAAPTSSNQLWTHRLTTLTSAVSVSALNYNAATRPLAYCVILYFNSTATISRRLLLLAWHRFAVRRIEFNANTGAAARGTWIIPTLNYTRRNLGVNIYELNHFCVSGDDALSRRE